MCLLGPIIHQCRCEKGAPASSSPPWCSGGWPAASPAHGSPSDANGHCKGPADTLRSNSGRPSRLRLAWLITARAGRPGQRFVRRRPRSASPLTDPS
jgi:hypothetical protein